EDVCAVVQIDAASDDLRIGVEPAAPEPIAQDDNAAARGRVFVVAEIAAEGGCDAEHREKVRRDAHSCDALRSFAAGERRRPRANQRELVEGARPRAPVDEGEVSKIARTV